MCKFWYDFVELKYGEKAKLCYMDTESVIVYKTLEKIFKQDLML